MSTFVAKTEAKKIGYSIRDIIDLKKTVGDIGVEIECEGRNFCKEEEPLHPYWEYHEDHSLRGEDNAEYVLRKPIKFSELPQALDHLQEVFDEYNTKLDVSNRTSVHVHVNVQDFKMNRLTSFAGLWFALEEVLTEWCGEHRVGNLFCLRAKDAPAIVATLKRFVRTDAGTSLVDGLHYAGLNANALFKFGSLEFRHMRGVTDLGIVLTWARIIERLYRLSGDLKDPREVCYLFSQMGPQGFLEHCLGDFAFKVVSEIGWDHDKVRSALYSGIRLAQDLCFCRDWDLFEEAPESNDPFGRSAIKVQQSLSQYVVSSGAQSTANEPGMIWSTQPPTHSNPFELYVPPNTEDDYPVFTNDEEEDY